ncbi:GAF domain-containing protein [Desulfococcaceae bacterium HSG9]|nr:GAF domain-containing protein [Desulfococcaceae bacterium HSG9]
MAKLIIYEDNGTRELELNNGDEIHIGNRRCLFVEEAHTTASADTINEPDNAALDQIDTVIPHADDQFLPENEIRDSRVLRADYEKLRITHELQHDIGMERNLDCIFDRILDRTFDFLNCERGCVLLVDKKGKLKPTAIKTRKPNEKFAISTTLLKQVREDKVGVITSDALTDLRFYKADSIIAQNIRSSMAVPLLYRNELLGVMVIDSSEAVNAYIEKDLNLLSNIANQTAQFIKNAEMTRKIERDAITREHFQRLLSPNLAEMVVSGELKVEKGGTVHYATVLFADIRGFTAMSENIPASEVLQMLNEFFEVMVDIVFHYEGTVDKFVGDMIMVFWGAPAYASS